MWARVVPPRANTEHLFVVSERSDVVILGLKIERVDTDTNTKYITVACFRCAKELIRTSENIRATNYCSSC